MIYYDDAVGVCRDRLDNCVEFVIDMLFNRLRGRRQRLWGLTFAICLVATGCVASDGRSSARSSTTEREQWVLDVLDLVESRAYFSDRVDWTTRRNEVSKVASTGLVYSFVDDVIADLADDHSRLLRPYQVAGVVESELVLSTPPPTGNIVAANIGYLMLPAVGVGVARNGDRMVPAETPASMTYVDAGRAVLTSHADTCGWIIDLRGNRGGNAFLMLSTVAPLLGVGVVSRFRSRSGEISGITLDERGMAHEVVKLHDNWNEPVSGPLSTVPVAVLTNGATASAAEAVAIAFVGRVGTRSFGAPTQGVPTANEATFLSDGALLILTVGVGIDRGGRLYKGPIVPDEPVVDPLGVLSISDPSVKAATTWLRSQTNCSTG